MRVIEVKGSTISIGLRLYLSKLLKKAVDNTVISFKFGQFDGKLKVQYGDYDCANYACVLTYSERCSVEKYRGAKKRFGGLCKPYDYNSKKHAINFQGLFEGLE